ncbi:MAG: hypothetical protein JNJ78_17310 [Anaerolineae bacterium]|nr:hypothetical protein [Anaerolineae bacterium]
MSAPLSPVPAGFFVGDDDDDKRLTVTSLGFSLLSFVTDNRLAPIMALFTFSRTHSLCYNEG